jgi:hypothetical protein
MNPIELGVQLDQLRRDQGPLPLTDGQATAQAIRLRQRHLSYRDISVVMGTYHGHWLGESSWRKRCRNAGLPARPHGAPFGGNR